MEIYGKVHQIVHIEPLAVVEKLKEEFLGGHCNWVEEQNNCWYIMQEVSMGQHSSDDIVRQIDDQELIYYRALTTVINKLKREQK